MKQGPIEGNGGNGVISLAGFGLLVGAAAFLGSRFNPSGGRAKWWYRFLRKPPFNPPNWVFPAVWTPLYALIAATGWRTWRRSPGAERTEALALWGGQLALNAAWSPLFFGARKPTAALADIVALAGTIGAFVVRQWGSDRISASMMVPYLAWVAFAAVLNEEIVRRN